MLEFEVGEVLAEKYEIKQILGSGGMGKVYRARQVDLGRDVALKVPSRAVMESPEIMARFAREARTVAKLAHDNIVQVYEFYQDSDLAFIAMEYVEGMDLKAFTNRAPGDLTVGDLARILELSCEGIAHAHEHSIVHRDIKPHNIMVARLPRGKWRVKVMDFGIAHVDPTAQMTGVDGGQLTQTGQALGTPSYMAPEQIRGMGVSHLSDLYSMGCVIYYCFTQQTVFTGSGLTVAVAHLNEQPPSILTKIQGIPEELDRLILRCLEKDPAKRPQDASELGQAIETALKPVWDMPMTDIWRQTLQASDCTIPIIKATTPGSGASRNLVEVETQQTIPHTDYDATNKHASVESEVDPTLPVQPMNESRQDQAIPSMAAGARASSTEVDATEVMGSSSRTEIDKTPFSAPQPASEKGAASAAVETTPPPATAHPLRKFLVPAIAVGVCALIAGVMIVNALTGPEPSNGNNGSTVSGNNGNQETPVSVDSTPEATKTPVDVAMINPTPAPTPEKTVKTSTPTPVKPTATPKPTPDPLEVLGTQINYYVKGAQDVSPIEIPRYWRNVMDMLRDYDDNPDAQKLILSRADDLAIMMATNIEKEMIEQGGLSFSMGSDEANAPSEEKPMHNVRLNSYQLCKYEVTALEFSAFLNSLGMKAEILYVPTDHTNIIYDENAHRYIPRPNREDHPANAITWTAAVAYIGWLNRETGKFYRLPSEAEWELAAGGRAKLKYPSGAAVPTHQTANFNMPDGGTEKVTQHEGNNGFYNMAGNVAEWCEDWYLPKWYEQNVPYGPSDAQMESERKPKKVLRGGGYLSFSADELRTTARGRKEPGERSSEIGFRLALTP